MTAGDAFSPPELEVPSISVCVELSAAFNVRSNSSPFYEPCKPGYFQCADYFYNQSRAVRIEALLFNSSMIVVFVNGYKVKLKTKQSLLDHHKCISVTVAEGVSATLSSLRNITLSVNKIEKQEFSSRMFVTASGHYPHIQCLIMMLNSVGNKWEPCDELLLKDLRIRMTLTAETIDQKD